MYISNPWSSKENAAQTIKDLLFAYYKKQLVT